MQKLSIEIVLNDVVFADAGEQDCLEGRVFDLVTRLAQAYTGNPEQCEIHFGYSEV